MPVRKSAVELAASRGEAEDRPSLPSGMCQPLSKTDCSAVASGHLRAWTHTTPIGVDRVRQVELREKQT
jgi:hypothetical protein